MTEARRRMSLLALIMALTSAAIVGLVFALLYATHLDETRAMLQTTARSRARFMEAIWRHEVEHGALHGVADPQLARQRVLEQLRDTHTHFAGYGRTGEFVVAEARGDQIVFLFRRGPRDAGQLPTISLSEGPDIPIRRALQGMSGTMIGPDYHGVTVVAAYEPVPGPGLGTVAKMDLAEVRAPYARAGLLAAAAAFALLILAMMLSQRVAEPIIAGLQTEVAQRQRAEARLSRINAVLNGVREAVRFTIRERDRDRLLAGMCDRLMSSRGFQSVWIVLLGRGGKLERMWAAGPQESRARFRSAIDAGERPPCVNLVLPKARALYIEDVGTICRACVLAQCHPHRGAVIARLEHLGRVFGVLGVALAADEPATDEEILALEGVAADLALALHAIEAEELRLQTEEQLQDRERMLRRTERIARVGGWELDPATGALTLTEETCRICALRSKDHVSLDDFLTCFHADDRAALADALTQALEEARPYQVDMRLLAATGEVLWVRNVCEPVVAGGRVIKLEGSLQDITEAKLAQLELAQLTEQLEQRVRERTAELQAANAELEAFAYSVSHDLRAPLRGIAGFGSALLEDYGDHLDDQARHYLQRIVAGTAHMGQLIDDLLTLSRVTRAEMNREAVDLGELAREVDAALREQYPQRQVQFRVATDLRVYGDRRLLRILLTNLLDNAWKFTSPRPEAHIELGATELEGETVYYLRDDGVGFDMAYADKLFTPFQRLHRSDEFPGTGIGLATVRRIVTRHGGRVWIEGEVNTGTTVYFTLLGRRGDDR